MSTHNITAYWLKATSSGGRREDVRYYRSKAAEHVSLISLDDRSAGSVDLACGSGELLLQYMDLAKVGMGIDFSQSMLDRAAQVLAGRDITLRKANVFDYLPESEWPVWMTTGGLNQYLDQGDMNAFLDVFAVNQAARSLYLFDCIDHLRYLMLWFGSSYRPAPPAKLPRQLILCVYRSGVAAGLALGLFSKACRKIGSASMGYGYLPRFWIQAAAARGFDIEIVSSLHFEYRYHVVLRKSHE